MIKSKDGKGTMKGRPITLLAEYSSITKGLVEALVQNGVTEEEAREMVRHAHRLGLMTDEDIKKEAAEKIGNLLKRVADKIQKSLEEEEVKDNEQGN